MFRKPKALITTVLAAALLAGGLLASYMTLPSNAGAAADTSGGLAGKVQGAGSPIAGSTVTLYAAGEDKPVELAKGKTGEDGTFKLDVGDKLKGSAGKVLYLVARGGTPKATGAKDANDAIALLSVLG